ncbi:sugar transferase [Cognatiyoonia sp. IB215182]|uniref:sugar transferase n=1 Tax=Cognatiyoonia sp. IB215182 TaxID=3097353 RepID=UPI002A1485AF|nr:sugar transferase [Cognatiyoonia sp. IB215182]MDX8350894.1 sugar transferase [Cognatiyoonia sp. IB215182]
MFDFRNDGWDDVLAGGASLAPSAANVAPRRIRKRAFDWTAALMLMVPLALCAFGLLILNPFLNRGPLIFRQERMGMGCRPFTAYKFRSMSTHVAKSRGAFDALETDRITKLGRWMRRFRIDELPQIINVLRGEMSMIGPRPDSYDHACVYVQEIPGYRDRHQVLPGITGLAQTQIGYVDGLEGIQRKVAADAHYIRHASLAFDLWITWRTLGVILARRGS